MNGSGTRVISASLALMLNRIAPVMMIMRTSDKKSSRCSDRNTQMRSDPRPMRLMRSPVRLPPKNSSDNLSRCS